MADDVVHRQADEDGGHDHEEDDERDVVLVEPGLHQDLLLLLGLGIVHEIDGAGGIVHGNDFHSFFKKISNLLYLHSILIPISKIVSNSVALT